MKDKFIKEELKIIVKTVRVTSVRGWKSETIYECLKEIEQTKGFRGFTKIYFAVDEFPLIEYTMDWSYEEWEKFCSDCGNKLTEEEAVECISCLDESRKRAYNED